MAFTRWPALLGLQRSFRRILHDLSWEFARSPGPRSLAWERFACFCDSGMTTVPSAPWYALSASVRIPALSSSRRMPRTLAAVRSWVLPTIASDVP